LDWDSLTLHCVNCATVEAWARGAGLASVGLTTAEQWGLPLSSNLSAKDPEHAKTVGG
jgi:hypothetical protein